MFLIIDIHRRRYHRGAEARERAGFNARCLRDFRYSSHHHFHTPPQQRTSAPLTMANTERVVLRPLTAPLQTSYEALGLSAVLLISWVVYLLLPKGLRRQYCGAQKRRYARHSTTVRRRRKVVTSQVVDEVEKQEVRPPDEPRDTRLPTKSKEPLPQSTPATTPLNLSLPRYHHESPEEQPVDEIPKQAFTPSFSHPALVGSTTPPNVLQETLTRLSQRGLRLTAHGVQSDPRRVWLRHSNRILAWQTEFPQSIHGKIVMMRGPEHTLPLRHVLYVDVGKNTQALQQATTLPATTCFALLTQDGSLDLQAHSRLERDAIVACLCLLLDQVHGSEWRELYEESVVSGGGYSTLASEYLASTALDI